MNRTFKTLTEQEYNAFSEKHEQSNFLNSIYSGKHFMQKGWHVEYVGVVEDSKIVCACLLVSLPTKLFGKYYYAPRGFLIDYANKDLLHFFISELKKHMQDNHGLYLKIDPYVMYQQHDYEGNVVPDSFKNDYVVDNLVSEGFQHSGFLRGRNPSSQCRWMSAINLKDKTKEDLLKSFDQRTRRAIRKAEKANVQIRQIGRDEIHLFVDIMKDTTKRQGFKDFDASYYESMMDCYQDKFMIVVAEIEDAETHEKTVISGASFILYGNEVIYLSGGTYSAYLKYSAMYLIQWYMIEYAVDHCYPCYNFYGISGYFEKGQEGYGVFEFKRGYRAEVIELVGDFILPIAPLKYKMFLLSQKIRK